MAAGRGLRSLRERVTTAQSAAVAQLPLTIGAPAVSPRRGHPADMGAPGGNRGERHPGGGGNRDVGAAGGVVAELPPTVTPPAEQRPGTLEPTGEVESGHQLDEPMAARNPSRVGTEPCAASVAQGAEAVVTPAVGVSVASNAAGGTGVGRQLDEPVPAGDREGS